MEKDYRFYQCVDNPFKPIICKRVNYTKYDLLPNSQLHFVNKIIPEFLDPLVLKYKIMKNTKLIQ